MFGIEKKYHIYINDEEYDCIVHCLIDLKNNLLMRRYTDAVDDVLIKVLNAKKKKIKVVFQ